MTMYAVPDAPEEQQLVLNIQLPKAKETFDLDGKGFKTDLTLEPMMRVKGTFEGFMGKANGDFLKQEMTWKVIVDDATIEVLDG